MSDSIHWFRRDLRIKDNTALYNALESSDNTECIFIFDNNIIDELPKNDHRISFIYDSLVKINKILNDNGSKLKIYRGDPVSIFKKIIIEKKIQNVFINKDYEPYAITRDKEIKKILESNKINLKSYKDHVIFEEKEITKKDGKPYTVYTPYSKKWLEKFDHTDIEIKDSKKLLGKLKKSNDYNISSLEDLGFIRSKIKISSYDINEELIRYYDKRRDIPGINGTSKVSAYLRFGLISIRELTTQARKQNLTFLKELIWRDFYIQILFNFPHVIGNSFKSKYDSIIWENNIEFLQRWKSGKTGYPIVDAGMRELNATGFMHNRVRMITSSFLCKHLLVDWRFGEAYFALKLFDFELASNNGNWQWAAGSGCDAAPYFRIFNPYTQIEKFDKKFEYINKWVPEYNSPNYSNEIVEHKKARLKAIEKYKKYLN